jgi:1-acyl-sn-glycerol-3-phosphate acyltransferase
VIRSIVLVLFYAVVIPIVGIPGIIWTVISGSIDLLYRVAMKCALAGVQLVGVNLDVRGLENFDPKGTYIYMCNHVSNLDPPIVIPLTPRRTSVMVKKEVFRIPILAQAMRMASFVEVDRSNREAAIASVERGVDVLKSGINISVFPEGTRSPDGKLLPFKKGPFHLAMESGVSIIPMTIYGTETMMPKGDWTIRRGTATVVFHPPVDPKGFADRDQLMSAVRDVIASALPERMRG